MASLKLKTQRLQQAKQKKRILVVDDDEDLLKITCDLLTSGGYEVETAEDGDIGIKKYLQGHHDLIITDMYMPRVPGISLITNIREGFPEAKIIAMSGGAPRGHTGQNLAAANELGVNATLNKPVTREVLLDTVKKTLA